MARDFSMDDAVGQAAADLLDDPRYERKIMECLGRHPIEMRPQMTTRQNVFYLLENIAYNVWEGRFDGPASVQVRVTESSVHVESIGPPK
jgi:hypothetical protein